MIKIIRRWCVLSIYYVCLNVVHLMGGLFNFAFHEHLQNSWKLNSQLLHTGMDSLQVLHCNHWRLLMKNFTEASSRKVPPFSFIWAKTQKHIWHYNLAWRGWFFSPSKADTWAWQLYFPKCRNIILVSVASILRHFGHIATTHRQHELFKEGIWKHEDCLSLVNPLAPELSSDS